MKRMQDIGRMLPGRGVRVPNPATCAWLDSVVRAGSGMSVSDKAVDVAIVGLGPVGATLALLLTQAGLSITVLERVGRTVSAAARGFTSTTK